MALTIDRDYLTQTLVDMVRINSCNPSLTPGSPGEAAMGDYTAAALRRLGLDVTVHELGPGRENVVGILRGGGGGRSLLLNAHLDTVGVVGMEAPFSAEIRDGKLYGRGSQDMKGSLAAMLAAAKALVDSGAQLAGDVLITAVADEEYASIGTLDLVKHYSADAAIVTEPTDMQLCLAHRGFAWYDVASRGRAAHGSRYVEGIDAIMRMGRFLSELDKLEQQLRQRAPHPLVGPPSLHASLIHGGTEVSVYAATCDLRLERRTVPGETLEEVSQELQVICDRLNADNPTNRLTVTLDMTRSAFEIASDHRLVGLVQGAMQRRFGRTDPVGGATFWTDAAILADAGIPTVLLGPVGAGLHSAVEWVALASLVDLAAILADVAVRQCGG